MRERGEVPYDIKNPSHVSMLDQLWNCIFPGKEPSKDWRLLGFQVEYQHFSVL